MNLCFRYVHTNHCTASCGGGGLIDDNNTDRFTPGNSPVRLRSAINVDWLLGGIYTHEDSSVTQEIPAINSASGAVVAIAYHSDLSPATYREYAAFGDPGHSIITESIWTFRPACGGGHINQTFSADPL